MWPELVAAVYLFGWGYATSMLREDPEYGWVRALTWGAFWWLFFVFAALAWVFGLILERYDA